MEKQTKQILLAWLTFMGALLAFVAVPVRAEQLEQPEQQEESASEPLPNTLWLSEFVSRAQLTSRVESREPVDQLAGELIKDGAPRRIYFFTEINGLRGEQVRHQWIHQERVVADLTFPIGADRWRTWSSKLLPPRWVGDWRVRVLSMDGEILAEQRFSYR